MIFSFSEIGNDLIIPSHEKLDVFCFFKTASSVYVSGDLWFPSVCASLRMKHEVLILEQNVTSFPKWDSSKRWVVGENWCWLAPRALSSLQQFHNENSNTYPLIKAHLSRSK